MLSMVSSEGKSKSSRFERTTTEAEIDLCVKRSAGKCIKFPISFSFIGVRPATEADGIDRLRNQPRENLCDRVFSAKDDFRARL